MKKNNLIKTILMVLIISIPNYNLIGADKKLSLLEKYENHVINLPQDKLELEVEEEFQFYEIRGIYHFRKELAREFGILLVLKLINNNLKKYKQEFDLFESIKDKSSMFIVMNVMKDLEMDQESIPIFFPATSIYELLRDRGNNS